MGGDHHASGFFTTSGFRDYPVAQLKIEVLRIEEEGLTGIENRTPATFEMGPEPRSASEAPSE